MEGLRAPPIDRAISYTNDKMFRIHKDPELPTWVFVLLRTGTLLVAAGVAWVVHRCST